jgi:hypothetical protein
MQMPDPMRSTVSLKSARLLQRTLGGVRTSGISVHYRHLDQCASLERKVNEPQRRRVAKYLTSNPRCSCHPDADARSARSAFSRHAAMQKPGVRKF